MVNGFRDLFAWLLGWKSRPKPAVGAHVYVTAIYAPTVAVTAVYAPSPSLTAVYAPTVPVTAIFDE